MNKKITRVFGSYGEVNINYLQYEFAFKKACDVVVKYDFDSEICSVHRFSTKLKFIEEGAGSYEEQFFDFMEKYVIEEDKQMVYESLNLATLCQKRAAGEDEIITQFRVKDEFGKKYWLMATTYFYKDKECNHLYTIHRNVTKAKEIEIQEEQKRIEEAKRKYETQLSEDEYRYKILMENIDMFVFEWVKGVGFSFRTEPKQGLFDKNMIIGKSIIKTLLFGDIVHEEDMPRFRQFCCELNNSLNNKNNGSIVVRLKNIYNVYEWYKLTIADIYDNGERVRRIGALLNVDELFNNMINDK